MVPSCRALILDRYNFRPLSCCVRPCAPPPPSCTSTSFAPPPPSCTSTSFAPPGARCSCCRVGSQRGSKLRSPIVVGVTGEMSASAVVPTKPGPAGSRFRKPRPLGGLGVHPKDVRACMSCGGVVPAEPRTSIGERPSVLPCFPSESCSR